MTPLQGYGFFLTIGWVHEPSLLEFAPSGHIRENR